VLGVPLKGEFGTVIGPSGSGKSTLYDILAGLEEPSAGAVELDGPAAAPTGCWAGSARCLSGIS